MNEKLAQAFDVMARQYKGDRFRKRAYENASHQIRNYDKPIKSGLQARREIKGIGESIAAKIDEILESGTLKQIEAVSQAAKEKDTILKTFEKIYGVGVKIAEQWYGEGYRSLQDLRKKYPEMTPAQQLGYKYYEDLQKTIPRSEIDDVNEILKKAWEKFDIRFVIGGSYRRGEQESSDIDIIVEDGIGMEELLFPIRRYIVGNLTKTTGKTWFGLVKFANTVRRMDILLVEPEEYPYTLIYFTGDKRLNIELRTYASKLGYKLTGHELLDPKSNRVYLPDEKAIFDFFNLKYLHPEQRKGNFVLEEKDDEIKVEKKETKKVEKEISGWIRPSSDLFIYISPNLKSEGKIAAFDLDGTLIRPKVGEFARAVDDVVLMPKRLEKLNELIKSGHTIAIFTNQMARTEKEKTFKFNRVIHSIKLLNIPLILFMSSGDDKYRKPNIGMWESLLKMIFPIKSAFYVGNSAGRPQDHSSADINFAKNASIPFHTPEEFFS